MDQLHELALGAAQRIWAAKTEAERYELGVEEKDGPPGEDLVELAAQVLRYAQVLMEETCRAACKQSKDCQWSESKDRGGHQNGP